MKQCASVLDPSATVWVRSVRALRALSELPATQRIADVTYLLDGLELDLVREEGLWELVTQLHGHGSRVVVSCYSTPQAVASQATVLDERDLRFSPDETAQIAAFIRQGQTGLDLFLLPESLRGCPWLVGRDAARIVSGHKDQRRVASELGAAVLYFDQLHDSPGFLNSDIGQSLMAACGLPVFTERLLDLMRPGADSKRDFARMATWPLFVPTFDEEFGEEALEWVPGAWQAMKDRLSAEEYSQRLAAGLDAQRQRGSVVGQILSFVLAGRLLEAEIVARENLRRIIAFAPPKLFEELISRAPEPNVYPSLALFWAERQSWKRGDSATSRAVAAAAIRALAGDPVTEIQGEFGRSALVAFGGVLAGDRFTSRRLLDHLLEMTYQYEVGSLVGIKPQDELESCDRRRLVGYLYLAYWAAVQLDRHEDATTLAELMSRIADPTDRLTPMEEVCKVTQADLLGTSSLAGSGAPKPDDPLSHGVSLRNLEDFDDEAAVEHLRTVIEHPGPLPSRSAIDGLVLLVRALAEPDDLLVSQVDEVVARSQRLWYSAPSSFVALGAMVAYATLGDSVRAARLVEALPIEDVFASLTHVIWGQWRGNHRQVLDVLEGTLRRSVPPRFEVLALVLQAASQHALGDSQGASRSLRIAWRTHHAPRLLRFAFRFVPQAVVDDLIVASGATGGRLSEVLDSIKVDARHFTWTKRPPLTASEVEILQLLRKGLSNTQIAEQRFVVVGTLRNQLKSIYRKLEVRGRHEAVDAAERLGIFGP